MILIIGGAYQGKLDYALERFALTEDDVCRCSDDRADAPERRKIVYEFDKWILALLKASRDVPEAVRLFMDDHADVVVICNDISCGVVPIDPLMRSWREAVGRALAEMSRASDEVVRLYCGIPTRIK